MIILAKAFEINETIEFIDLHKNKIGKRGAEVLSLALINNKSSSIKGIGLWENQIGFEGALSLIDVCTKHPIYTLDLRENQIGQYNLEKIASRIPNTKLHSLDLRKNNLKDQGIISLLLCLCDKPKFYQKNQVISLKALNLSDNFISDEGCFAIAKFLTSPFIQLEILELRRNKIGAIGCQEIALALTPNIQCNEKLKTSQNTLHYLDISYNDIKITGIYFGFKIK